MTPKIDWLTARPIAHRGLHNASKLVYENSLSACKHAIDRGFNIEVDLHPASDRVPVVFHDLTLERMSADQRKVRQLSAAQLQKIKISQSLDYIATLEELLELTAGKVGLVLEMKGVAGENEGFVASICNCLNNYRGPVAIMSFNHWLLREARILTPELPLGLVAQGSDGQYASHKMIADKCNIDFCSYKYEDLPCKFSREFRDSGKPLICWTIKTAPQFVNALGMCDQATFEGFDPDDL
jgi:glycerophosphoryl diester phosphodiesterase